MLPLARGTRGSRAGQSAPTAVSSRAGRRAAALPFQPGALSGYSGEKGGHATADPEVPSPNRDQNGAVLRIGARNRRPVAELLHRHRTAPSHHMNRHVHRAISPHEPTRHSDTNSWPSPPDGARNFHRNSFYQMVILTKNSDAAAMI